MSTFGHDCLYYFDRSFHPSIGFILFCLRPETTDASINEKKSCNGERIAFKELQTNNVSTAELFWWNAVIETIDLYAKYLLFPDLVDDDDEYYCNCSLLSRFGKSCQYDVNVKDSRRTFTDLLDLGRGIEFPSENLQYKYFTCYVGIRCVTNLICLDWRQICNGVIDCDGGEDEPFDLCLQMESRQCHPETEFRCKTGLCVPLSMAVVAGDTCPDQSHQIELIYTDLPNYRSDPCLLFPSVKCDESNHGWKQFSCNNGEYISFSDLTAKVNKKGQTCANDHHLTYLKKLFFVPEENECWKSMMCLSGFDYLYSHISCSNETILTNIERYCPNEYSFPLNSVVYSFVFFLYDKVSRTNWMNYTGPNYICYKEEHCPNSSLVSATISKKNLKCLSVNERIFSWKNFYESVLHLFSSCYFNPLTSVHINEKMLYKCHLSTAYISIYRLKDKKKDCFYNDDEDSNINLCSFNTNDQFKCLTNENECIRQSFLGDQQYDCSDGSDEYFRDSGTDSCRDMTCDFRHYIKRTLPEIYRFEELCDNIVNRHVFSLAANETDETDCEYWPYSCNSPFTKCNQIWNCANGQDETDCEDNSYNTQIRKALGCKSNEHYCIQLKNNNRVNATCININRSGDGIIDCIGGIDERLTTGSCTQVYPTDFEKRFHCLNSSLCIRSDQVCDRIINCPFEDDERICPWLLQSNSSNFHCSRSSLHSIVRCERSSMNDHHCWNREHLWFCDLQPNRFPIAHASMIEFEAYPPNNENLKSISFQSFDSNQLSISEKRTSSLSDTNTDIWLCNFGYLIRSSTSNNRSYCLCPPSYYGDYCQYQSERLTARFRIQIGYPMNPLTVFRLIIYLLNENNLILSYDEIIYSHELLKSQDLYSVYLMYEKVKNLSLHQRSKSKFVRVDSYMINKTNVQYISSWLFDVSFPFLPVNRIVVELFLRNQSLRTANCSKRCGAHGKCMYYVNLKHIEYCWCERGWFGERCEEKSSSNLCNQTSCAPYSQCVILNDEKQQIKCICPLGKSGDQCYVTNNTCSDFLCENNGTCLPIDRQSGGYDCICKDGFQGKDCENTLSYHNISIDANITNLSPIPAIIVIFDTSFNHRFKQRYRVLFKNITLPTTFKITGDGQFGFVQMFHNFSKSFYYLVSIRKNPVNPWTTTSVISRNLCPNVTELFNQTVLHEYSYLKRLKLYHLPCQHNHDLRCFFDEYRMCICTRSHNSDCHFFYHETGNCDYCYNGGLCLRQDSGINQWNYMCLCPECSYGSLCQFSPVNYFITLDMLIGVDMQTGNVLFNQQPIIIHLTLLVLILILVFSLIFNTISIIVFSNKKLRQVGCDLYLLNLTIVSQIGLILLFLRFVYMIMVRMYLIENVLFLQISCLSLEYLLRLIPSLFDWLTVCISIERAYTIIKDVQFTRLIALKTLKTSRWIIFVVFLGNILTTLHRLFYLTLFDEPSFDGEPQGHPWCVLDFQKTSWDVYEKVINICHLLIPLVLNLLSVISFISYKIKLELISTTRKNKASRSTILKEQLMKYKPLLLSTVFIILLEIPRFVLTFTLACVAHAWQRYLYLGGYLISFLPLTGVVFIYIIPSPKYKTQFKIVVNKIFCRSLFQTARDE